jgi:putative hemolysin
LDDSSSTWAATAILVVALLLMMALAAAEGALATISRTRLRAMSEQGRRGAETALQLIDAPAFSSVLSLSRMLLISALTGAAIVASWGFVDNVFVTVIEVLLAVVLLQTVAAAGGTRGYSWIAPSLAPFVNVVVVALTPLHLVLSRLHKRIAGSPAIEGEEAVRSDEEELRVLAGVVGEDEAVIPDEGREMIYSIVSLAQTTVREVMVPRPDIIALRSDTSIVEALDTVVREGHSRIPVFDDNIDNIIGILYAKDLLAYLRDGRTDVSIRDVLRPAIFVPTSRMADQLLQDLQGRRVHLAIVFDEYGGTAGLVTIEDLLEEIVGEIQDEYDAEEEAFVQLNEYEAIVSGRLDIDDLNDEMNLDLPTDENDTVGGLIYSALGRVPLVGDEVRMEEQGVTFNVIVMAGRRISSVRVMVDHSDPQPPEEAGAVLDESPEEPAPSEREQVSIRTLSQNLSNFLSL